MVSGRRRSRLRRGVQEELIKYFCGGVTARAAAEISGVNRNTAASAYRQLMNAGVVITLGRGGTRVAGGSAVAQEGFAADTACSIRSCHSPLAPASASAVPANVDR